MSDDGKYNGLWRGYVVDNADPLYLARVRIQIPEVYGKVDDIEALPWAPGISPIFGGGRYNLSTGKVENKGSMEDAIPSGLIAIPPIGACLWVQFEHGDPQHPVYCGAWFGRPDEVPAAAANDEDNAVSYPQIAVIQVPWAENMYIRFSGNRAIEIVMGDLKVQLVGEVSEGAGGHKIRLFTERGDIELSAEGGAVSILARSLQLVSKNDATLQAGKWRTNDRDELEVDTQGSLRLLSTKDAQIRAEENGSIASGEDGEWHLSSPRASGFDNHGN